MKKQVCKYLLKNLPISSKIDLALGFSTEKSSVFLKKETTVGFRTLSFNLQITYSKCMRR